MISPKLNLTLPIDPISALPVLFLSVCKNDYLEPEYMLEVQRENYLYLSKEECCKVSTSHHS